MRTRSSRRSTKRATALNGTIFISCGRRLAGVSTGAEEFANHLERPLGRGHVPDDAFTGAAGGAACGDLIRISIAIDAHSPQGTITDAGFDASGCGATLAAGSAIVGMVRGTPLLQAARI